MSGKRKRALSKTAQTTAFAITSKTAPLSVRLLICHDGTRTSLVDAEQFALGKPVREFNGGEQILYTFRRPGERLEIDLEAYATKEQAILKNYTRPGGLSVSLCVQYEFLNETKIVYAPPVHIIGSTKRKRHEKKAQEQAEKEGVDDDSALRRVQTLPRLSSCNQEEAARTKNEMERQVAMLQF